MKEQKGRIGAPAAIYFLSNALFCDSAVKAAELKFLKPRGLVAFISVESLKAATSFYFMFERQRDSKDFGDRPESVFWTNLFIWKLDTINAFMAVTKFFRVSLPLNQ